MEEGNGVSKDKNDKNKLISNPGRDKNQATNFLERFSPENQTQHSTFSSSSSSSNPLQEPDLNLRLTVGGNSSSSSSETSKENPLTRSSSIGGIIAASNSNSVPVGKCYLPSLPRACSLPAGPVQQQRIITMREIQSMRRIHAKNRLIEKQRISKEAREAKEKEIKKVTPTMPSEAATWATASAVNSPALCRALLKIKTEGLSATKRGRPAGQSTDNASGCFKVPAVPKNAEPAATAATPPMPKSPPKKARVSDGNSESNGMDVMRQMPSVRTTGDGPNGRRVEGFLYTYTRTNVSIVCLCHGIVFTPAEFVKHAGGGDVPNPMKHITVYSTFDG
ncbi:hypothetical protein WN943_014097 [Citrus x changshan-huyou]